VNRYVDDEDDEDEYSAQHRRVAGDESPDREFTLGTATIVGIFFALALGAAVVFGAGYTLGRKSAQNAAAATAAPDATSSDTGSIFGPPKPAAGSQSVAPTAPATQPATDTPATTPSAAQAAPANAASAAPSSPPSTSASDAAAAPADRVIVGDKPATPPPQSGAGSQPPATTYVVQVAAVSSQDVANILLASLQKKGYSVAVHHEPQDNLLHVQIGPFAKRGDAEAMRQRVLADGFNAIVK
jgi:cell division septation protein DedD